MRYYKLTDSRGRTRRNTQWGENVTHKASGKGEKLCTSGCIHVYDHPLKAALFNPIHAKFINPILWEVKVKDIVARDTTKVGVRQCTTIRQVPFPTITTNQRVRVAILVALSLPHTKKFDTWAKGWLSGRDRTYDAYYTTSFATHATNADNAAANAAYNAAAATSYATHATSFATSSLVSIIKKALKLED